MTIPVTVALAQAYFDAMYQAAADPWGFEDRWYEQRKYAVSLALLPAVRYRSAFEPGCSIGVLTRMLAGRCDAVLSCDVAATAVRAAARRTADLPHVQVERRELPADGRPGRFDLIVFSEIPVLLRGSRPEQTLKNAISALEPDGTLLAVHWRHPVADYPRSGGDVHLALADRPGLSRLVRHAEPDFLAEAYIRTDGTPVSVAQATGLV